MGSRDWKLEIKNVRLDVNLFFVVVSMAANGIAFVIIIRFDISSSWIYRLDAHQMDRLLEADFSDRINPGPVFHLLAAKVNDVF